METKQHRGYVIQPVGAISRGEDLPHGRREAKVGVAIARGRS
jgi:hypothetical protein